MATKATRLPSGSYRARAEYREDGRRKFKSFTVSLKNYGGDWRAAARQAELLARQWESLHPADEVVLTVPEAVAAYIDNRSAICSPSTIRGYRSMEKRIREGWQGVECRDVTQQRIQSYINSIASGHTPKTTRNIGALLLSSLREAMPEKHFTVSFPRHRAVERHIPTDADVRALLAAGDAEMRLLISLAAVATLRLGEACALRYEDIDREHSCIRIRGVIVHDASGVWSYKDHPKTAASSRVIILPQEVLRMLGDGSGFIFQSTPAAYGIRFQKLRDRLGLRCRFHDLRHYSASIMAAIGIPSVYAQERGGWSSDAVLRSVYQNPLLDQSVAFAAKTNEYFSEALFRGTNVAQ